MLAVNLLVKIDEATLEEKILCIFCWWEDLLRSVWNLENAAGS